LTADAAANDACDAVPEHSKVELLSEASDNIAAHRSSYQLNDYADGSSKHCVSPHQSAA
jgi:hypothetical protein